MLSVTVISGNSARFWKISAVGRLLGPMPAMSLPPMRTVPSDGSRKPETVRRIVVLPQPEGPRKVKNSPLLIRSVADLNGGEIAETDGDSVEFDVGAHAPVSPALLSRALPVPEVSSYVTCLSSPDAKNKTSRLE